MRVTRLVLLLVSFFLFSCEDDTNQEEAYTQSGVEITPLKIGENTFYSIKGNISSDLNLTSDKTWVLDGAVFVLNGSTLSIEPGTNIYGAFGNSTAYLTIQQGAKIEAIGTAEAPITFSTIRKVTSIPQPGDWGGIILNGRAPINVEGGITQGEGGSGQYGGNLSNDNSGTLKYVIVEYGGKILGDEDEMNNISLNGCGSKTIVDNVQALYGKDDGIEIFGGTVNISHAIAMGNGDDSFDWSLGWTGLGQYWLVVQGDHDGDRGIEADNNEDNFLATTISDPIVANLTIIGADDGDANNTGIMLRHGTQGKIYNALVTNFPKNGVEVKDSSLAYIGTSLIMENSHIYNNGLGNANGVNFKNTALESLNGNSTDNPSVLSGYVGVIENEGVDLSNTNSWFESNTFIGAVHPSNDWTTWANQLR